MVTAFWCFIVLIQPEWSAGGLSKLILVRRHGTQRLLEPIGNVPPVEYEMNYYRSQEGSLEMARLN